MKIDLREKLKEEKEMRKLALNHREIFEKKLNNELHSNSKSQYVFIRVAAAVLLLFSLGYIGLNYNNIISKSDVVKSSVNQEGFSSELKNIENYYLTAINYQMAKIKITDENKELIEVYLSQLSLLQKEYAELTKNMHNNTKLSEKTIDDIIENLQLRLHLMRQLKGKLENLNLEENENSTI